MCDQSTTTLKRDTLLERIPELKIELRSNNTVYIWINGRWFNGGKHGLAILNTFYKPQTIQDVLKKPPITGMQDWADFAATITRFYNAGILHIPQTHLSKHATDPSGFAAPSIHVKMLNDQRRTRLFLKAIQEVIQPNDIVLDIGTGTGILAIAAAQAGARHVYAVEAETIGKTAREVFSANSMADRITLIEGWSTQIELPERADVLVSEIVGNDPLGEQVLDVTRDASKRLLKPGARLLPNTIRVFCQPVEVPEKTLAKQTFTDSNLEQWKMWYKINLTPLKRMIGHPSDDLLVHPYRARQWKQFCSPILMAEFDLKQISIPYINQKIIATTEMAGSLNGVLVSFELELSHSTTLSSHPESVDENHHWRSLLWYLPDAISVSAGTKFSMSYTSHVPQKADGISVDIVQA